MIKMNNLQATIMVPVYNAEKFVEESLQSAIRQTFPGRYEVIVINDGSTDQTGEILEKYHKQFPKLIKVFHQENQGTGATRNRLLKESKGEVLLGLDADDFLHPMALEKTVYYFDKSPKTNIVYTNHIVIDEDGKQSIERKKQEIHKKFKDYILHFHFPGHLRAFRKSSIQRGFDSNLEGMSEDYDFLLEMLLRKWPEIGVEHISDPLYFYRVNPNGLNQTKKSASGKVLERKLNEYDFYRGRKVRIVPVSMDGITFLGHKVEGSKTIKLNVDKVLIDYLKEVL